MDFDFSAEQRQMQQEAHRFLLNRCSLKSAREALEKGTAFDRELWTEIADLGWTSVPIPEAYGGLGLGALELCVIAEEIGRFVAPIPMSSSTYLATQALVRYGSASQKERWLPQLASGRLIATLALHEGRQTAAEPCFDTTFDNGRISGRKIPVPDGAIADFAAVVANEKGVIGLYVADLSDASVERTPQTTIDPTRGHAAITFRGTQAERLGDAEGWAAVQGLLDYAAVLFAFEQLGGADACLDMARTFVLERQVFGRTLGSYQAIKHKLADIYVKNQLARSNCYYGAWAVTQEDAPLDMAACLSRLSATQAYAYAAQENIHVHGAMGFTWEADCHLFLRRAKHLGLVLGAERVWRERMMGLHAQASLP